MPIKMVVFDFDGVLVESSLTEKIWRRLAEKINIKTPKFLFFCQEIVEFIFNKRPKPIKETIEKIKKLNQNCCFCGILTDRSLWSLWKCFLNNNLDFKDFVFVQTRESIMDYFIEEKLFLPPASFKSKKTKPNFLMFKNLKKFAAENKINIEEIIIIDDLTQAVKLACANGFSAIHIKHVNYVRYI